MTKNGASNFNQNIRKHLLNVQRPAQYIGEEPGSIVKDWDSTPVRLALGFPDIYEVGMSYHGREVLYQAVNSRDDMLCERVFLPGRDMEAIMLREKLELWTLESKRPVREFDALGISFTFELSFPSGLLMIKLAGIPLYSADRGETDPVIIGGGQCMCNPEPIAPFLDVAVNGEGEEVLIEILDSLRATADLPRSERLLALGRLPGCYVPSLYSPDIRDGSYKGLKPLGESIPARIPKRIIKDFGSTKPPVNPVQPYIDVPSNKAYLEVMRGCPQGCRFCQAGFITRPARARDVDILAQSAGELARNTGTDEIGLMSLSTLDHPQIAELLSAVKQAVPGRVGIGLPSMRADAMSRTLAVDLRRPRESSLTVAIEAGDQSIRESINKRITDEDIRETFTHLMSAGWHKFKLYFMCGFLNEPLEAVDSIADTVGTILGIASENGHRKPRINVSVSVLVPKPHTPFQWQAMDDPARTQAKQQRLRDRFKRFGKSVQLKWHDATQSVIECLIGRGGRELAPLMERAMQAGQTLPSDYFDYNTWLDLVTEQGISLQEEVFSPRDADTILPWVHIDRGVSVKFLKTEQSRYETGESTPPCHEYCNNCGLHCSKPVFAG